MFKLDEMWPLPWRVEEDWCYEIIAANGTVILKLPYPDEKFGAIARRIVEAANNV